MAVSRALLVKQVHARLSSDTHLTKQQVDAVVRAVFEEIKMSVDGGDTVTIFEFGRFEPVKRSERVMNNQVTKMLSNAPLVVPAKIVPVFRASAVWLKSCREAEKSDEL